MKLVFAASLAATLAAASVALACEGMAQTAKAPKEVNLDTVATLMSGKTKAQHTLLDANNADTRAKYGVIPGAVLLSSYDHYDVKKELPADKQAKLIFYCGGELCSAAPEAAKKAIEAGYTDVNVMKVGIKGWTAAGKPVTRLQS